MLFLLLLAIPGHSRELTGKTSMWWHFPFFHIYTPSRAFCKGGKNSDKAVFHNQETNLRPETDFVMAYSVYVWVRMGVWVCMNVSVWEYVCVYASGYVWWILSSIGQPRVCYMERRKHNFFLFFKEGLRNMVQATLAAVLGAVDSETGQQRS